MPSETGDGGGGWKRRGEGEQVYLSLGPNRILRENPKEMGLSRQGKGGPGFQKLLCMTLHSQ